MDPAFMPNSAMDAFCPRDCLRSALRRRGGRVATVVAHFDYGGN